MRSPDDEEIDRRPLEWGLIRRLFGFATPYRGTCLALAVLTVVRSAQLPLLVWAIGAVIGGPITRADWPGTLWGAGGFLALALATTVTFHFRQRLALQFGEAVVHDLRLALFAHLLRLKLGFFTTTKIGRIIGRMTSDVEAVRSGVQDVLFISIVQAGQMLVAAALMLWYDWMLFTVVLVLAPALLVLNRFFRVAMSRATREVQESFSAASPPPWRSLGQRHPHVHPGLRAPGRQRRAVPQPDRRPCAQQHERGAGLGGLRAAARLQQPGVHRRAAGARRLAGAAPPGRE